MEMVEKESPDLVAICTTATGLQKPGGEAPTRDFVGDSHADDALKVVNAGVPMLFVEKAMSCSIAKADAVLRARLYERNFRDKNFRADLFRGGIGPAPGGVRRPAAVLRRAARSKRTGRRYPPGR